MMKDNEDDDNDYDNENDLTILWIREQLLVSIPSSGYVLLSYFLIFLSLLRYLTIMVLSKLERYLVVMVVLMLAPAKFLLNFGLKKMIYAIILTVVPLIIMNSPV